MRKHFLGDANCCDDDYCAAEDVTLGGPQYSRASINILFCRIPIPRNTADYDHFVFISEHELMK
jgi:hypothetical protein